MNFLPETPLPILYALVLAAVCAFAAVRERRLWPVVAVMALNWTGTRAITSYDAPALYGGLLDLASAIVLAALAMTAAMAVLPVAALFGLMVGCYVLADLGFIGRETMWAWADVGAYLQLLVIAGCASSGGSGRLARVGLGGGRVPALARAVAHRVPPQETP